MDDRELLELAAKAAGIKHPGGEHCINGPAVWDCEALRWWRPLTDDGDALRLAVKLNIHHSLIWDGQEDEWSNVLAFRLPQVRALEEFCAHRDDQDEYQATRRAIVRVAAEIGRAM